MNKVIVDKARLFRRAIIISWITLALCFIVKIFGGNFFEIMCENHNYKRLCLFIDDNIWFDCITATLSCFICQSLYLLAILQQYKFKKWQLVVNTATVIASSLSKIFFTNIGVIFDILLLFIVPIIFLGKQYKKYWHTLVAFAITFLFQLISLVVKNLSITVIAEDTFISLIFNIDVYIMAFLYYLYRNNNKESKKMGKYWVLFMGKPEDKLLAMKAKCEAKAKKYLAKAEAIELEISKRKSEK
jgi:hypothetical protein